MIKILKCRDIIGIPDLSCLESNSDQIQQLTPLRKLLLARDLVLSHHKKVDMAKLAGTIADDFYLYALQQVSQGQTHITKRYDTPRFLANKEAIEAIVAAIGQTKLIEESIATVIADDTFENIYVSLDVG